VPVAALMGYTNAGKSTVMNMLSGAGVLAEDKLFATLDTTTRALRCASGGEFLLTDTVGFIRKLPHQLIKAFRATLLELQYADILIHVVDISNPEFDAQMDTVYKTAADLGLSGKPVITVYNKIDIAENFAAAKDINAAATLRLSALTGEGKDELYGAIEAEINKLKPELTVLLPYTHGELLNLIHKNGEVITETYEESGIRVCAHMPPETAKRLERFLINDIDKAGSVGF
jgi:GTP-binding protein HflX